jgi:hypothetical protein
MAAPDQKQPFVEAAGTATCANSGHKRSGRIRLSTVGSAIL